MVTHPFNNTMVMDEKAEQSTTLLPWLLGVKLLQTYVGKKYSSNNFNTQANVTAQAKYHSDSFSSDSIILELLSSRGWLFFTGFHNASLIIPCQLVHIAKRWPVDFV